MIIVVDSSVAESMLHGGKLCRLCLDAIEKNKKVSLMVSPEWKNHWNKELRRWYNSPQERPYLSFLLEWETTMRNRMQDIKDQLLMRRIVERDFYDECKQSDRDRLYLVQLAHASDRIVIFCDQYSPACVCFSNSDHPDMKEISWKTSTSDSTIQWIESIQCPNLDHRANASQ